MVTWQDPNFVVATKEEQENLDGGDYDGVNLARKWDPRARVPLSCDRRSPCDLGAISP